MRAISAVTAFLAVLLAGCAFPGNTSVNGSAASSEVTGRIPSQVRDQATFIEALRARGVAVDVREPVQQPFLQAPGTRLRLTGGNLGGPAEAEPYEYSDAQAAAMEAAGIEPDGNPKTTRVTWIDPPHFFRAGRLIVLYVGADSAAVRVFEELLGPQFAGA